jgi:hypothetical protein
MSDLWLILYKAYRLSVNALFAHSKVLHAGSHESLLRQEEIYICQCVLRFAIYCAI